MIVIGNALLILAHTLARFHITLAILTTMLTFLYFYCVYVNVAQRVGTVELVAGETVVAILASASRKDALPISTTIFIRGALIALID
jgi:hypothetical protein